jgi:YHS domain-containing protein
MIRLLLIAGLLVMAYFLLRRALREFLGSRGTDQALAGNNEMIQDPVCRAYVPRGDAIAASIGGQTYYFCSQGCADTFQKQLSG